MNYGYLLPVHKIRNFTWAKVPFFDDLTLQNEFNNFGVFFCRQKNYGSDLEDTDPEMMFAILASLGQTIVRANDMEK